MIGVPICAAGLIFAIPTFQIEWYSLPRKDMQLRTTGFYGIVRHPIYLGEVLWFLGWAIMFQSIYGLALVPMCWAAFLFHTLSEEAALERELGSVYLEYKKKVRGRIFPGLRLPLQFSSNPGTLRLRFGGRANVSCMESRSSRRYLMYALQPNMAFLAGSEKSSLLSEASAQPLDKSGEDYCVDEAVQHRGEDE